MRKLARGLLISLTILLFACKAKQPSVSTPPPPKPAPRPVMLEEPAASPTVTEAVKPVVPKKTVSVGQRLAEYAQTYVGTRYKYAGGSPKEGFDCSGFTCFVYQEAEISLPRSSRLQAEIGEPVSLDELRPGDLLFFKNGSGRIFHVAFVHSVATDHYTVVHATSRGVVMDRSDSNAWDNYWRKRVAFARRVPQ